MFQARMKPSPHSGLPPSALLSSLSLHALYHLHALIQGCSLPASTTTFPLLHLKNSAFQKVTSSVKPSRPASGEVSWAFFWAPLALG